MFNITVLTFNSGNRSNNVVKAAGLTNRTKVEECKEKAQQTGRTNSAYNFKSGKLQKVLFEQKPKF